MREIAKASGRAKISLEDIYDLLQNSSDPAEREFGLKFDRAYAFRAQGADWLGGDFYGSDGAPVMRFARAIGVPHIVWESQANIAWDYLKHFRRDLKTGESIYDAVSCWGER
jgi:hypothetical protein